MYLLLIAHVSCDLLFLVKFAPGKKQSFAIISYVNLILEIIIIKKSKRKCHVSVSVTLLMMIIIILIISLFLWISSK